ncbi:type II toxin-antitoxin system RelE/ParE family toxin [Xenorhabdus sp. DI]|uniref:type II toxin-antitoxin system RelE/ParE family toxin n=1 Tax=Xenorhabdus doucetiae TaxID=351671 RepID=UPI0019905FF1|nr:MULTISPECIES: type II toxin-antitoxin system RelE/ParE family toxin [unclassified Xenorhabdus]MBD2786375.1 type II toxin-antitoxin system RelE/ParE family toxin [Xenorhabdus sp. 3]MBD2789643.1 type II toxin-antitoxin system RelE/ParE family toxin [Xenorhabdus sp. DI]MBD2798386.1 type II toxin-antitoxin system RelE/ParE family toxin [Xenorhabdus sp. 18]
MTGVIPAQIEKLLLRKLDILEAASTEKSLFSPPGNNYERLEGNSKGWSSIRVSIQWRGGTAYDVYLDPHKYR